MIDSLHPSATERVVKVFETLVSTKKAKSFAEICRNLHINHNYLTELKKGKFCVTMEIAESLINTYSVNREFIYNGVGEMFAITSISNSSDSSKSATWDMDLEKMVELLKKELEIARQQNSQLINTNALLAKMLEQKRVSVDISASSLDDAKNK